MGEGIALLLVGAVRKSILALLFALSATQAMAQVVDAEKYDSYFLWAGVTSQTKLENAKTLYILDAEFRPDLKRLVAQRSATPKIADKEVWICFRLNGLELPRDFSAQLLRRVKKWQAAGNNVQGIQIDFDAKTRGLENYAKFLADLRHEIPKTYSLSVTGLLDWGANGDIAQLNQISQSVDEIIFQTYQGRHTHKNYKEYLARYSRLQMPFKIALVQNGEWVEPEGLRQNEFFRGYVVYLINR